MWRMLGIDLGGTQIKSSMVTASGEVKDVRRTPTPQNDPSGQQSIAVLSELILEYKSQYPNLEAVGLVVPGLVDAQNGISLYTGTLGWRNLDIAKQISDRTGIPVALEHDVTAGGLAELKVGVARGLERGVVIQIGTALAAAFIIDGKIFHPHPSVGEVGHAPLPNNRPCVCGKTGCVEMTVSGGALARNYKALTGKDATAFEMLELQAQGDAPARELLEEFLSGLAFLITWLASSIAPQAVVISGGIALAKDFLVSGLEKELDNRIGIQLRPEIRISELSGDSGCIGAGMVAYERFAK